jgi:hypothetical protein
LAKGRLLNGKCSYRHLGCFFNPILGIGLPPVGIDEGINAARLHCRLITIKGIAGKTHHLAGTGYIPKLGCKIKQTCLVLDNILLNATHGVTPLRFQRSI